MHFKGFKSLSLTQSLMLGCEVGCWNMSTLTAARPGWVTLNKASGSSLPMSVSGAVLISCHPFACGTGHILQLSTKLQKTTQKIVTFPPIVVIIVLSRFLPLVLSQLTTGCLLKKVNKPAANLRVSVKG